MNHGWLHYQTGRLEAVLTGENQGICSGLSTGVKSRYVMEPLIFGWLGGFKWVGESICSALSRISCCRAASAPRRPAGACGAGRLAPWRCRAVERRPVACRAGRVVMLRAPVRVHPEVNRRAVQGLTIAALSSPGLPRPRSSPGSQTGRHPRGRGASDCGADRGEPGVWKAAAGWGASEQGSPYDPVTGRPECPPGALSDASSLVLASRHGRCDEPSALRRGAYVGHRRPPKGPPGRFWYRVLGEKPLARACFSL